MLTKSQKKNSIQNHASASGLPSGRNHPVVVIVQLYVAETFPPGALKKLGRCLPLCSQCHRLPPMFHLFICSSDKEEVLEKHPWIHPPPSCLVLFRVCTCERACVHKYASTNTSLHSLCMHTRNMHATHICYFSTYTCIA